MGAAHSFLPLNTTEVEVLHNGLKIYLAAYSVPLLNSRDDIQMKIGFLAPGENFERVL